MISKDYSAFLHSAPFLLVVSYDRTLCDQLEQTLHDDYQRIKTCNPNQVFQVLNQELVTLMIVDILNQQAPDWEFFDQVNALATTHHYAILLLENFPLPPDFDNYIDDYLHIAHAEATHLKLHIALQIRRHRRYLEQVLTIQHLQQAQETHRNLAEMASHDLRHPMGNIRISEAMIRELSVDDMNKTFLDSLLLSINNLETMFDDFISAMLLGERVLKYVAVDLQVCVDNVYLQYLFSANNKNIVLEQENLDYLIYGDMTATEQIINNLVSNAIKYSFFDSRVCVSTERIDNFIMLKVTDQGQGVIESERSVLFTRFGRVSSQPTNNEPTVGLGLWIVKQLTESMGGTVGAHFPDGGGALFWVMLPIYQAS